MLKVSWTAGYLALVCIGCGDNLSPAVTTRTQVIPAMDGKAMAYVLEPLLVTTIHEPWSTQPYAFTETGPTMLVDLDSDQPIGSFSVGMTHVVTGSQRAWVLQSTSAEWQGASANAEPAPRAMSMAVINRETLDVGRRITLDPPIDTPVVLSDGLKDDLLDVSRTDDPEHQVIVRLRFDNGTSQPLSQDTGTMPVWCTGQNHLVYAYQVAPGSVRVLEVQHNLIVGDPHGERIWGTRTTDLPRTALGTTGIACADKERVVFEALNPDDNRSYLVVLDLDTHQPAFSLAGLAPPFAISADGTAVVARRTSDDRFVLATNGDNHLQLEALDLYASRRALPQPVQVGDQALFSTGDEYRIIDLKTGKVGTALEIDGADTVRAIPWNAANGFALMRYHDLKMTAVGIADANGVMPMDLPPVVRDPQLLAASGSRMYIAVSADNGTRQVYGFDPSAHGVVSNATSPECNPHAITNGSCR